jgi:hypothetical protein
MVHISKLLQYAEKIKSEEHHLQKPIILRLSGVTFDSRQQTLSQVNDDTPVRLQRDRRNEYDYYAVKVEAFVEELWKEVGFLPKPAAKKYAPLMDSGDEFNIKVHALKGGGQLNYGLDICITPKK